MTTYTAIASPDERSWHVRIPGLGNRPEYGLPTMARSLAEVQPMARDLIAVWLEVPENSFDIQVEVELPAAVQRHLERAATLRSEAAGKQSEAAREYRAAALELKARGLTVRDIGRALGVSHQRAQQLVAS